MIKEENKMLEIIHQNCKKEQLRRYNEKVVQKIKQKEQHYNKLNKILMTTGIICIIIEIAILVIERMVR